MESTEQFSRHVQINYLPKHGNEDSGESFAIGFEPAQDQPAGYGNLYLIFEQSKAEAKIDFEDIVKSCGKAFYESGINTQFESRFKMCLRTINEIITKAEASCNIGLVAISNGDMLFSNIGTVTMLHARKVSVTSLSSKIRSKLFQEIGQGKLHQEDKLIMVSQAIAESFTAKELARIVTTQPLKKAESQISASMQAQEDRAYSALLIESVRNQPQSDISNDKDTIPAPISTAKFAKLMKEISQSIKSGGKKTKQKLSSSINKTKSDVAPKAGSKIKQGWTDFWSKYINPNPKKAIIAVFITIFIIFSVVLGTSLFSNGSSAVKNLDTAATLLDSAQASLSKNNQASAQESLDKAKDYLSKITPKEQQTLNELANSKKIKNSYSTLSQRAVEIGDKITATTRISTNTSFNIPQSNLRSLVWAGGTLYGLDAAKGSIIEINPLLGQPIERANNSDLVNAKAASSLADTGVAVIGSNNLWQYIPDSGLQQLKTPAKVEAIDIASYLNNIYLLSPTSNQVVRYAKSGTNLSSKTALLKNVADGGISKATAFAVKANIFIANGNKIQLFEQGSERTYNISNLPASFGDIKSLYYNSEAGYFILLNSKSNRLALVLADTDSATFSKIYALPNDENISSFTMEPKSSLIFINSATKIISYKIEK